MTVAHASSASILAEAKRLHAFLEESNRIEGLERPAFPDEFGAASVFLSLEKPDLGMLCGYVALAAGPRAVLRDRVGLDVRVGSWVPPRGAPEIRERLEGLLFRAANNADPFRVHCDYETLHPFLDGNGRSGRLLWLWMMRKQGRAPSPMGFLQSWYYQSLEAADGRGGS